MVDPVWLIPLFVAFFASVWTGILTLASRMGGWARLASAYRCDGRFDGFRMRFASGEFRGGAFLGLPCNYGGCLTLGSNRDGMYLAVLLPFRPGHPALFIPWRDVTARVERGWLLTSVTFAFDRFSPVRLRVSRRLAERLILATENSDTMLIEQ